MKCSKSVFLIFSLLLITKAWSQTADEIIDKNLKAMGGKETWKKVTSIKEDAIVNANGTEINIAFVTVHNKGFRQTVSVAGMQGYTIYTPEAGWNFYPWQGQMKPEAVTPEDIKENEDNVDVQGPLLDYKDKGHTVEYLGTDDYEGTECYKIKLTEKGGKIITYYIDPSNYFIIHSVTITKANGQESESKSDFSNYQKLPEGLWVAMNVGSPGNVLKIKKVEINPIIDETLFKPANN